MNQTIPPSAAPPVQGKSSSPSTFDNVTAKVSEGLHSIAQRVEEGVAQLEANPPAQLVAVTPHLSHYGHRAAEGLERSAEYVRNLDVDQLKEDATQTIRRNPGTSLLVAAGIGFILGGILKKRGL